MDCQTVHSSPGMETVRKGVTDSSPVPRHLLSPGQAWSPRDVAYRIPSFSPASLLVLPRPGCCQLFPRPAQAAISEVPLGRVALLSVVPGVGGRCLQLRQEMLQGRNPPHSVARVSRCPSLGPGLWMAAPGHGS